MAGEKEVPRMKVQAFKANAEGKPAGFYGTGLKYDGEVFNILERKDRDGKKITCERQFSKKWMKKVKSGDTKASPEGLTV